MKQDANSTFPKCKARLVVKGFRQKKGVDFNETFSPVVKMSSIKTVLSLTATLDLEVEQMDVKTTFLHGKQIVGIRIIRERKERKLWLS